MKTDKEIIQIVRQLDHIFKQNELTQKEVIEIMLVFADVLSNTALNLLVTNLMAIEIEKNGLLDKNEKS
jgi:hypothetical protein